MLKTLHYYYINFRFHKASSFIFFNDPTTSRLSTLIFLIPFFFFFNDTATTEIYTLSLHDALPISETPGSFNSGSSGPRPKISSRISRDRRSRSAKLRGTASLYASACRARFSMRSSRSEEHTSELQSLTNLVCRLLLV